MLTCVIPLMRSKTMRRASIVAFLLVAALPSALSASRICVRAQKPITPPTSCTKVFDSLSNATEHIDGPTEVVLLDGWHYIEKNLTLNNVADVTFTGNGSSETWIVPVNRSAGIFISNSANVTFSDIRFVANVTGFLISTTSCRNVSFSDVTFDDIGEKAVGLSLTDSLPILVERCSFRGQKAPVTQENTRGALYVIFNDFEPPDESRDFHVIMRDSSFANFSQMSIGLSEVLTSALRDLASVPLYVIFNNTKHVSINVDNVTFDRMQSHKTTTIHIVFINDALNNSVLVSNSTFTNCQAKVGAGLYVAFAGGAENNTICVKRSTFHQLQSSIEGGAIFGIYLDAPNNTIYVNESDFDALLSLPTLGVGSAIMVYCNRPSAAVAVMVYKSPYQVFISDSTFTNNTGSFGVIFARGIAIQLDGENRFTQNSYGGAIQLYQSMLRAYGKLVFAKNTGSTGGAMSLYDKSIVDMSEAETVELRSNKADSGGAFYFDDSTGQSFVNWVNYKIGLGGILRGPEDTCIFTNYTDEPGDLGPEEQERLAKSIQFVNNGQAAQAEGSKVIFANNGANVNGLDIAGSNFFTCTQFFTDPCVLQEITALGNDSYVQNQTQTDCTKISNRFNQSLFKTPVHSKVATNVDWLFFQAATCSCLKPMHDNSSMYWKFHDACPAQQVIDVTANELGNAEFSLFDNLGEKIGVKYPIPPREMFSIPWSESWASRFLRHSENGTVNRILNESGLILAPSSGERFDLHIAAFDQFLRRVNSSVGYISLQDPDADDSKTPNVLMRQGRKRYSAREPIIFRLNKPLSDFALVGFPGAEGNLTIRANTLFSDVTQTLTIGYKLSRCPLGYNYIASKTEVNEIIRNATTGIVHDDKLACQCLELPGVIECSNDKRHVTVAKGMWAGDLKNANASAQREPTNKHHVQVTNGTLDELINATTEFAWGQCVGSACNYTIEVDKWELGSRSPCRTNRVGQLCGRCEPGYTVSAFDLSCIKCTGGTGITGAIGTILIFFALAAILIALAMLTDIAKSTTFDTLLFAFQITPLVASLSVDQKVSDVLQNLQYLFIQRICFTSQLSVTGYQGFQFFFPALLLTTVFVIIAFSRCPGPAKLLSLPRSLKALVFMLIFSYNLFTIAALQPLQSNRLYTTDNPKGNFVTFFNGSLSFSDRKHVILLPFCAITLLAAVLLPIAAVGLQNHPRVKPVSDIYTSFYRDTRKWWISVNLGRRLVITSIATGLGAISGSNRDLYRQNFLLLVLVLLTMFHVVAEPFHSAFANHFEMIILLNITFIAMLTIPPAGRVSSTIIIFTAMWPFVAGFFILLYNHRARIRACFEWIYGKITGKSHHYIIRTESELGNFDSVDSTKEGL